MRGCCNQRTKLVVRDFCMGVCEERISEESPLLEAVAREWLVKIQQARKGLVGAVVICEWWRLVVAL
jgi:hypothetical protein